MLQNRVDQKSLDSIAKLRCVPVFSIVENAGNHRSRLIC